MQNKSIWHTADEKPMLQRDIILCGDGWSMPMDIIPETVNNICWKNVEKWCYVDDLIKENDRTRKALDVVVDALNFYANKQHYKNEELDLYVYEYEDNNETGILDLDDGGQMENGKKARDALAEVKTALEQKRSK